MTRELSLRFVVLIVVILGLSLSSYGQSQDIKSLKKEIDLLEEKVNLLQKRLALEQQENEYLRKRLESLKSRTVTNPKGKPTAGKPSVSESQPGVVATTSEEGFQITLHENLQQWWTDPDTLFFELSLRDFLVERYPEQSVSSWLARHNGFAGQKITWQMRVRNIRDISGIAARKQHLAAVEKVNSAQKRVAMYKESPKGTERERIRGRDFERGEEFRPGRFGRDSTYAQAALNEAKANLALWEQLDRSHGGAIVELEPAQRQSRYRLTVRMPVTGDDAIKLANMKRSALVKLSGKILSMWSSGRGLNVVATGTLTRLKEPEKPKTERSRRRRRRRPPRDIERRGPLERGERRMMGREM